MKKLLWLTLFWVLPAYAQQPRNPFPTTPDQIWQNDLDLSDAINNISTGTVPSVNCATVTCAGSSFNGPNQLIQTDSNGAISLTSGTINNLTFQNTHLFDSGIQVLPVVQIQTYQTTTTTDVFSTSYIPTKLSGSFTPKFSTSKVFIIVCNGQMSIDGASQAYLSIFRDTTDLAATSGGLSFLISSTLRTNVIMTAYDSPGTTSAVTYTVKMKVETGAFTAHWPVGNNLGNQANMIIIEYAQ